MVGVWAWFAYYSWNLPVPRRLSDCVFVKHARSFVRCSEVVLVRGYWAHPRRRLAKSISSKIEARRVSSWFDRLKVGAQVEPTYWGSPKLLEGSEPTRGAAILELASPWIKWPASHRTTLKTSCVNLYIVVCNSQHKLFLCKIYCLLLFLCLET
jgi:hypothetical protein